MSTIFDTKSPILDKHVDITFKEKSLWVQIVAISIVFGSYFLSVGYKLTESLPWSSIPNYIWLVVGLVVLNIIGHVLAAAFNKPEREDERDKLIELKATKIKAILLAAGIVTTILAGLKLHNEIYTINLLILLLVISEITEKAAQLFFYRKNLKQ